MGKLLDKEYEWEKPEYDAEERFRPLNSFHTTLRGLSIVVALNALLVLGCLIGTFASLVKPDSWFGLGFFMGAGLIGVSNCIALYSVLISE